MAIELRPPLHSVVVSILENGAMVKRAYPTYRWADLARFMTQAFGENKVDYSSLGIVGHSGEDYSVARGNKVYAAHEGIVSHVQDDVSFGTGVEIVNRALHFKTVYWHFMLGSVRVELGEAVDANTVLGQVDNTGFSFGDHLHFGFKVVDENGATLNADNGYRGALDPTPYKVDFIPMFITEADLDLLYRLAFLRAPDAEANFHVGHSLRQVLLDMLDSGEFNERVDALNLLRPKI